MDDVKSFRELKVMSRSLRHMAVECVSSFENGHRKDRRSGNSIARGGESTNDCSFRDPS